MSISKLKELLRKGRKGHAILFCGAGLTADCLSFNDSSSVGVTSHLLDVLNDELKGKGKEHGYKNIKNAAKYFKKEFGVSGLISILQERFSLSSVSASISDIMSYPWSVVYTTNFDNGIDIALRSRGIRFQSVNNTFDPSSKISGLPVVHLHGGACFWDIHNFETSCVLDSESYRSLSSVKAWLRRLRHDIEKADVVIFVGFSSSDVHLEQVFYNASGLKNKAFFINKETSSLDVDEKSAQEDFGVPIYIGRDGLSGLIYDVMQEDAIKEPSLASFSKFTPVIPSESVPSVDQIEDLFIWGKVDDCQIKRDVSGNVSDYHVVRSKLYDVCDDLNSPGYIVFVHGDICDGKSVFLRGVVNHISSNRPVFELNHTYDDIVDELVRVIDHNSNAVFVIENCFSIGVDRLNRIVQIVSQSEGALILSARSISTEAEIGKLGRLRKLDNFREFQIDGLIDSEADALVKLIDQIAGWRGARALSEGERRRFVVKECEGVVPRVLLNILNSEYVRNKYKEEYNKTNYLEVDERQMIIAAMLISNLGLNAPLSFLSEIFEMDLCRVLGDIYDSYGGGLRLLRVEGERVYTVPSIGARNVLRSVIDDREIVDTTIKVLERISEGGGREDFEQHVFAQFMRYSILSSTVETSHEINRFFDHISKIDYFRGMPLFWLQWHMAMCEQKKWLEAEKYLSMGYTAADAFEKRKDKTYNRKQLDDRKAKFLCVSVVEKHKVEADLFRDFKEALDITGRLLRDRELTHHSFETLLDVSKVFKDRRGYLMEGQPTIIFDKIRSLLTQAENRVGNVPHGFQRSHASRAIDQIVTIVKDLEGEI